MRNLKPYQYIHEFRLLFFICELGINNTDLYAQKMEFGNTNWVVITSLY